MERVDDDGGPILVLAPVGRDAKVAAGLIEQAGHGAKICPDLDALVGDLSDDTVAVLVAEEAFYGKSLDTLTDWVRRQSPWSDLAFVILTTRNDGPKFAAFRHDLVQRLGNVSFLERPLQTLTLQTSFQSAGRARRRQYEARLYLERQLGAAHELERLVRERTQELEHATLQVREESQLRESAQAALAQAQKIETVGQLVGGVAHDFNNLLMAIIGNLDLLSKGVGPDPRLSRLLTGAMEGARRGATLTQRLLAFARKQELQATDTDVAHLVEDMKGLIERSVGPLVHLEVRRHDPLPTVRVDPNQLEMALLNLAVNARDAMPFGGHLTIDIQADELGGDGPGALPPGHYLRLAVRDTGEGMDPTILAKAVEPFFSTKGVGKGTGLGLSMVHGLAEQSGGAFHLESQVGVGTTAILWLPVATGEPEIKAEPAVDIAPAAPAIILLVDDDFLIAASTAALLEDLGHEVVESNSGAEALERLEGGLKPDLVITDHAMPGMTGMQLAEAIHKSHPHLPILLATGYADLADVQDVRLPRLAKPYTQQQLSHEIGLLLARPSDSRPSPGRAATAPHSPAILDENRRY
jgi:signal transduction histidine kinase/CheY-like chemotaxis protein